MIVSKVPGRSSDSELGRILRNERISPLFQPVADVLEQKIICYEALSRGVYPLESPTDLFRAAADLDLLWEVEEAARSAVLRRIATFSDLPGLRYFMNISLEVLCDERFTTEYILRCLEEFSLGPGHIGLEIVPGAFGSYPGLENRIAELSSAGIGFSLDDFDPAVEGHLQFLLRVKPEYAKLPRGLVHELGRFNMGQQSIRKALALLKRSDAVLVAKGVEDWDELETLLSLGVRMVQGYLVARPEKNPPGLNDDFEGGSLRAAAAVMISNRAGSDSPVVEIATMPMVVEKGKQSCEEMDRAFQHNPGISHVVIVDAGLPTGLVTRKGFYLSTGGRFGYSVFQRETVDAVADSNPMITGDGVRVTEVSTVAMERPMNSIYDPVIVVDLSGVLIGTVTVKQLLDRTIEAERNNSGALDPVTGLPGNVSVRRKLMESIQLKTFTLLTANINGFRTFNLIHGFGNGDRMIMLLADLIRKHIKTYVRDAFIGQLGHDRFAVVSFTAIPVECLRSICREFDRRSGSLFYSWQEQETGRMELTARDGSIAGFPLCTVSVAVTCSDNYVGSDVPAALVLDTSMMLLKKLSKDCSLQEKSDFVFDTRIRKVRSVTENTEARSRELQPSS